MRSDSPVPPGTQTLRRGLDVLSAVARGADDLRGISEATGVSRSTTHRLLQLLTAEGYLRRGVANTYVLGPTLIEFGFLALQQNPVPLVARPVLERLSVKFRDTVHLAIRDNDEVLYLDKIPSLRGPQTRSRVGYRMPLTRTGIGRALLLDGDRASWARLFAADAGEGPPGAGAGDQTSATGDGDGGDGGEEPLARFVESMRRYARTGAALDMEENEPGVRCVAAPVRDASAAVVAAISVSATRPYMPMERMRALVPVVCEAAAEISAGLGHAPSPGPG